MPQSTATFPTIPEINLKARGVAATSVDLANGYHMIVVHERFRDIFSFRHRDIVWRAKRMCQGYRNATVVFNFAVATIFSRESFLSYKHKVDNNFDVDLILASLIRFSDDLTIIHATYEVIAPQIDAVMFCLQQYGAVINLHKTIFAKNTYTFLNHRYDLTMNTYSIDEARLQAINNYTVPSNKMLLNSRLCTILYYNKFLPACSYIIAPLFNILKKDKYEFTNFEFKLWRNLIFLFQLHVRLYLPTPDTRLIISTDSSSYAAGGAMFAYEIDTRQIHCCGLYSRCFSKSQLLRPPLTNETQACAWILQHFSYFIETSKHEVILLTDASWLSSLGTQHYVNMSLYNLSLIISSYSKILIQIINSSSNVLADALSRSYVKAVNNSKIADTLLHKSNTNFIKRYEGRLITNDNLLHFLKMSGDIPSWTSYHYKTNNSLQTLHMPIYNACRLFESPRELEILKLSAKDINFLTLGHSLWASSDLNVKSQADVDRLYNKLRFSKETKEVMNFLLVSDKVNQDNKACLLLYPTESCMFINTLTNYLSLLNVDKDILHLLSSFHHQNIANKINILGMARKMFLETFGNPLENYNILMVPICAAPNSDVTFISMPDRIGVCMKSQLTLQPYELVRVTLNFIVFSDSKLLYLAKTDQHRSIITTLPISRKVLNHFFGSLILMSPKKVTLKVDEPFLTLEGYLPRVNIQTPEKPLCAHCPPNSGCEVDYLNVPMKYVTKVIPGPLDYSEYRDKFPQFKDSDLLVSTFHHVCDIQSQMIGCCENTDENMKSDDSFSSFVFDLNQRHSDGVTSDIPVTSHVGSPSSRAGSPTVTPPGQPSSHPVTATMDDTRPSQDTPDPLHTNDDSSDKVNTITTVQVCDSDGHESKDTFTGRNEVFLNSIKNLIILKSLFSNNCIDISLLRKVNTADSWYEKLYKETFNSSLSPFIIKKGILFYEYKPKRYSLVLATCLIQAILRFYHYQLGLHNTDTIIRIMKTMFYHPRLDKLARQCRLQCSACVIGNSSYLRKVSGGNERSFHPSKNFEVCSADVMESLPVSESGATAILLLVCHRTRYIAGLSLTELTAMAVTKALSTIFSMLQVPGTLLTDGSKVFSGPTTEMMSRFNITHHQRCIGHSQAQGNIEICVKFVRQYLTRFILSSPVNIRKRWDFYLANVLLNINLHAPYQTLSRTHLFFGPQHYIGMAPLFHLNDEQMQEDIDNFLLKMEENRKLRSQATKYKSKIHPGVYFTRQLDKPNWPIVHGSKSLTPMNKEVYIALDCSHNSVRARSLSTNSIITLHDSECQLLKMQDLLALIPPSSFNSIWKEASFWQNHDPQIESESPLYPPLPPLPQQLVERLQDNIVNHPNRSQAISETVSQDDDDQPPPLIQPRQRRRAITFRDNIDQRTFNVRNLDEYTDSVIPIQDKSQPNKVSTFLFYPLDFSLREMQLNSEDSPLQN